MISMCLVSYVVEILQLGNNLLIFFGVETFTKWKFDGGRSMVVFEIGEYFCKPIIIPNRTFLVRCGGIWGEFGRAMARILARRSRANIPMARPNEPDMPPKRTKKVGD